MIHDSLDRFGDYLAVHPLFAEVAAFLRAAGRAAGLAALPDGRHEVGASGCFALVSSYLTADPAGRLLECHRRHVDVQVLLAGVERIGHAERARCAPASWDEGRDLETLAGEPDWLTLRPGAFAVFLPQDAHLPGVCAGAPARVRKVVVKVPVRG